MSTSKELLARASMGDRDAAAEWFLAHDAEIRASLAGLVPTQVRPTLTTHNLFDTVRDMFVMDVAGEKGERLRTLREYDAMRIVERIARGVVIRYEHLAETLPRAVRDVAELADVLYEVVSADDVSSVELTVGEIIEHCGDDRARQLIVLVLQGRSLRDAARVLEIDYGYAKTLRLRAIEEVKSYVRRKDGRDGDS